MTPPKSTPCGRCPYEKVFMAKLETVKVRLDGMDEAVILRAAEMARTELAKERESLLRRDIYDRDRDAWDEYVRINAMFMEDTRTRLTKMETRAVVWTTVVGAVFVVLQAFIHFVWQK